jgi:UDP-N-acetylglucosamine 2-epimerase
VTTCCRHLCEQIGVPPPDVNLDTGPARQAEQTARTLAALDPVLARERPDWVLTYGDTNSPLAGTLAAAARELPIAHRSAGLRSFDRTMSAERNRFVADHLAGLLLAPTTVAMADLAAEGLTTPTPAVCGRRRWCSGSRAAHCAPRRRPETLQDSWDVLVPDPRKSPAAVAGPRPTGQATNILR